jgi:Zn-dependent protease
MASIGSDAFVPVATVSLKIILVNIVLAVFNALPIPPLDGSRIVYAFLSERGRVIYEHIERYSLVLVIAFTFFGWQYVVPVVAKLFTLCTGVSL